MTRPRAADDFAMIRSRMVELRRERAETLADPLDRSANRPGPFYRSERRETELEDDPRRLPRSPAPAPPRIKLASN
jgi:hypothetical protein